MFVVGLARVMLRAVGIFRHRSTGEADMDAQKTAVIVVHGVADQKRGDTVQSVVELLLAESANGKQQMHYESRSEDDVTIAVLPVEPVNSGPEPDAIAESKLWSHSSRKQSFGSDYRHEPLLTTPSRSNADQSEGVTFTNYLLKQAKAALTPATTYVARRLRLWRRVPGESATPAQAVDFFEMYWADLSRLGGTVPRIVTEMFTLLFRLSALGRDCVQAMFRQIDGKPIQRPKYWSEGATLKWRLWACFQWLQALLDWGYSRVLALLFLLLIVVALLLVPYGWMHQTQSRETIALIVLCVLAVGVVCVVRFYSTLLRAVATFALLLAAAFAIYHMPPVARGTLLAGLTALAWFALIALAYVKWLQVCELRFKFVMAVGLVLAGVVTLGVLLTALLTPLWPAGEISGSRSLFAAASVMSLRVLEVVLLLVEVVWLVLGIAMFIWALLGVGLSVAARRAGKDAAESRAIATGQLGVAVSLGLFLVVSMCGWALLSGVTETAAHGVDYRTAIYKSTDASPSYCYVPMDIACFEPKGSCERAAGLPSKQLCFADSEPAFGLRADCAECFLHARYTNTVESFAVLSILLFVFLGGVIVTFAPSLMAELQLARPPAKPLGRWLTAGYAMLAPALMVLTVLGALVAVAVVLFLIEAMFARWWTGHHITLVKWVEALPFWETLNVQQQSEAMLKPLVIATGSVLVILTGIGGWLSRNLAGLRAPLDAVLDVDNHFREFPRNAIPRARIMARYVALLDHLREQGYARIVIVAHSQGTIISADLLRYLTVRQTSNGVPPSSMIEAVANYVRDIENVCILTFGCPLRQLYAERFPTRYGWVGAVNGGVVGPTVVDIGVKRWFNAYCSGDYVGRWIWQPTDPDEVAEIERSAAGPGIEATIRAKVSAGATGEICLGSGAHTHYLGAPKAQNGHAKAAGDAPAAAMAGAIDAMISAP